MRWLITGVSGFAGGHLARRLLADGHQVAGVDLPGSTLEHLGPGGEEIQLFPGSLDEAGVAAWAVRDFRPDGIFHLAGLARVAESWRAREQTVRANFLSAFQLLEAARMASEAGHPARVLLVGSGEQYGLVPEGNQPIPEEWPLQPRSPYASAKCAQEALGYQYSLGEGLDVVMVRPFNHIGPGQRHGFVVPDFSRQISRIEQGEQEPVLRVGNLEACRDFTHVKDMVRGYQAAMERGRAGAVYNLGWARAWTIRELLDELLAMASVEISVEVDPNKFRPADIPLLMGARDRARQELGWEPEIEIQAALAETLAYWRHRVQGGGNRWME